MERIHLESTDQSSIISRHDLSENQRLVLALEKLAKTQDRQNELLEKISENLIKLMADAIVMSS